MKKWLHKSYYTQKYSGFIVLDIIISTTFLLFVLSLIGWSMSYTLTKFAAVCHGYQRCIDAQKIGSSGLPPLQKNDALVSLSIEENLPAIQRQKHLFTMNDGTSISVPMLHIPLSSNSSYCMVKILDDNNE